MLDKIIKGSMYGIVYENWNVVKCSIFCNVNVMWEEYFKWFELF